MKNLLSFLVLLSLFAGFGFSSRAADQMSVAASTNNSPVQAIVGTNSMEEAEADLPGIGDASSAPGAQAITVSDPIEPVNRAFYHFNDKLYFWALKPVSKGYAFIIPQPLRIGIKNIFSNIRTPVRLVNCALQGEFKGSWTELERCVVNSTVGVLGFGDPARDWWTIEQHDADLGQTLGRYGCGTSIYFVWPFLGPSNVRDTGGYVGDLFLDPLTYVLPNIYWDIGVKAGDTINATSLREGDYEKFKNASIDPYVAMRDAYAQYRKSFVSHIKDPGVRPVSPLQAP